MPLSAVLLLWLLSQRSNWAALWWLFALGLSIGATSILKIYFFSCPFGAHLNSPSGHTSFSVVVYGGLATIFASGRARVWQRVVIWSVAAALCAGIAVSRILLRRHSALEVEVGMVVGLIALLPFATGYARSARGRCGLLPLVLLVVATLALLHGRRLEFEELFRLVGIRLQIHARVCR